MNSIYIKAGIAIALLVVGFVGGCSHKQAELDRLKADYAAQVQAGLEANRQLEKRMQAEADILTQQYQKEKKDAQKTIDSLRSRIASGDIRLSVRTASTKGMSSDSSTEYREERAELDGETAQSLVSITADGDEAIRDLNQCIDKYNAIRSK